MPFKETIGKQLLEGNWICAKTQLGFDFTINLGSSHNLVLDLINCWVKHIWVKKGFRLKQMLT